MLSEISQVVKDKYDMISPKSGTYSTKQTSNQNITRHSDIKIKLTVTTGEGAGDNMGNKWKGHQRTCIKDTWTKPKGARMRMGGGGCVG